MQHRRNSDFKACYAELPAEVKTLADKQNALLKQDRRHPSLHFKRVGIYWSVRVGRNYRALAIEPEPNILVWYWIGPHDEYERLIK